MLQQYSYDTSHLGRQQPQPASDDYASSGGLPGLQQHGEGWKLGNGHRAYRISCLHGRTTGYAYEFESFSCAGAGERYSSQRPDISDVHHYDLYRDYLDGGDHLGDLG